MVGMYLDLLDVFNVECIGKYTYRVAKPLLYNTHFLCPINLHYPLAECLGRTQHPAKTMLTSYTVTFEELWDFKTSRNPRYTYGVTKTGAQIYHTGTGTLILLSSKSLGT